MKELETESEKGVMQITFDASDEEDFSEGSDTIKKMKLDIAMQTGVPVELIEISIQEEGANAAVELLRRRRTLVLVVRLPKQAAKKLKEDVETGAVSQIGAASVSQVVSFHVEAHEKVGQYASQNDKCKSVTHLQLLSL